MLSGHKPSDMEECGRKKLSPHDSFCLPCRKISKAVTKLCQMLKEGNVPAVLCVLWSGCRRIFLSKQSLVSNASRRCEGKWHTRHAGERIAHKIQEIRCEEFSHFYGFCYNSVQHATKRSQVLYPYAIDLYVHIILDISRAYIC